MKFFRLNYVIVNISKFRDAAFSNKFSDERYRDQRKI